MRETCRSSRGHRRKAAEQWQALSKGWAGAGIIIIRGTGVWATGATGAGAGVGAGAGAGVQVVNVPNVVDVTTGGAVVISVVNVVVATGAAAVGSVAGATAAGCMCFLGTS